MIPGPKIILEGAPGTGKTTSIKTLIEAGLEVGVLALDKNVSPILASTTAKIKTVNFGTIAGSSPWDRFETLGKIVNTLSNDQLQGWNPADRNKFTQMLEINSACRRFVADDGTDWGDITTWTTKRAFVVDGLSNLSKAARFLTVGLKPALTQPDWQAMMNTLSAFIDILVDNVNCTFVLISHLDREVDEVTGGTKIFPSTLGRKLGPVLGKDFSDVILATRDDDRFHWTTIHSQAELKAMNLPFKQKMEPSFVPLIQKWKERGGEIK